MGDLEKPVATAKPIKTNQSLVHIKHSITIRQYKYWHLLLKSFNEQLEQGTPSDADGFYYESRKKLEEFVGYELMTKDLKADIEALRKEPIIINYLEKDGKPAIRGMGFISEYKITSTKIGFRLPSFIEKVIKGEDESKKLFLLLNWNIFNSFSGKYEAIIYKLCKDYLGVGRTPYFTVDEYREYIGLNQDEYPQFFELNRWTIKKPLTAISESSISDIKVEVEFNKVGRTVAGLYFKIINKNQSSLPFENLQPSKAFELARVSISFENQTKYLEKYSEDEIAATIERANEYADQLKVDGKRVYMGAIYNKAFAENWGEARLEEKTLKQQEEQQKLVEQKQLQHERKIKEQQAAEALETKNQLFVQFDLLADDVKTEIVNAMLEKNKSFKKVYNILNEQFQQHGFKAYEHSPIFSGNLFVQIEQYLDAL